MFKFPHWYLFTFLWKLLKKKKKKKDKLKNLENFNIWKFMNFAGKGRKGKNVDWGRRRGIAINYVFCFYLKIRFSIF